MLHSTLKVESELSSARILSLNNHQYRLLSGSWFTDTGWYVLSLSVKLSGLFILTLLIYSGIPAVAHFADNSAETSVDNDNTYPHLFQCDWEADWL